MKRDIVITLIALASLFLAGSASADPERHKYDLRDLAMMTEPTRATFERGEALLLAGDAAGALPILEQAANDAPKSAIAYRRLVEAYTAVGRRDDAITNCYATLRRRNSAMDFRACVSAFLAGNGPISPTDMYQAVTFSRHAIEAAPDLPFGYAAQCDIARKIGDIEMLKECTKQLQRIAPHHDETRRAMAMASAASHPVRVVAAWLLLALACAGTLVHAWLRARGRRGTRAGAMALGSSLFCLLVGLAPPASAEDDTVPAAQSHADGGAASDHPVPGQFSTTFPIDDRDPVASVPPKEKLDSNPLQFGYFIMDLTERAEKAAERGDKKASLKYWQALAKATPDRSYAFAKMCATYEALGNWDAAVYSCAAVLERTGSTLNDYTRYVGMVLSKKGDLNATELGALDTVLAHLATDSTGKGAVDELACRIGARTWNANRLAPCTASLVAHAPNHPNTVYFQWALAVSRKDTLEARQLLARAREVSVKPEELRFMEKETNKLATRWVNYLGIVAGFLVAAGSGAGLVYVLRRRPKAPEGSAPSGATA